MAVACRASSGTAPATAYASSAVRNMPMSLIWSPAGFYVATVERNGYATAMLAKSEIQREALNLPAQERIQLVVELWDSVAPGEIPVPDWQRDLIRDRLAALEDVLPEERSVPWNTLRKRVFSDKT